MASNDDILSMFRAHPGEFVSGQEISKSLNVSRTAVWKKIRRLRELGFRIEAVTSRGYRLLESPDLLDVDEIQAGLGTSRVGKDIRLFGETDSTNVRAFELGEQGAEEGTVVLAEQQSAGKGRLGRHWLSPPGVNLYLSVLLRPDVPPYLVSQMTFVSAVAVARSVRDLTGLPAEVKWPNDILVNGKKVAGMLNEMSGEADRLHFVVLGIGLNLNMTPGQFPPDLRHPATSLAIELGRPVVRNEAVRHLLKCLDEYYRIYLDEGFERILSLWQEFWSMPGCLVEVNMTGTPFVGRVLGLDEDGTLLLSCEGETEPVRVVSGDVKRLEPIPVAGGTPLKENH